MALTILDTATRANEDPLSDGGQWTVGGTDNPGAACRIVSNTIRRHDGSGTFGRNGNYWNPTTFTAGARVQVGATMSVVANDGAFDLALFATATRNGYNMSIQSASFSADQLVLHVVTGGSGTNIDVNSSVAPANGDIYVLQVLQNDIVGWMNRSSTWTEVLRATDTTYRTGFRAGIEIAGFNDTTTMQLINFGANLILPICDVAGTVSGSTPVGSVLTATTGTWQDNGSPTFTYQWTRDGSNISSATSSTYTTVSGDATHAVGCTVTDTDSSGGTAQASSNTISVVAAGASTGPVSGFRFGFN